MKNSLGTNVILTLFGESHGKAIGAVLDGLTPGIKVDEEKIKNLLNKRRPNEKIDTSRIEEDKFEILSGVYNGYTTGTPICIVIPNKENNSNDYEAWRGKARSGHADYTGYLKYHGFEDYRGGGHFSGRLTAAIVAAGSIALAALENKNIYVASHIKECGSIIDSDFKGTIDEIENLKDHLTLDNLDELINQEILKIREQGDSIGGIIQTMIYNLPSGVGEPVFDSLESLISHALFSIGGIKGIEFGDGFKMASRLGSEVIDEFHYNNGKVVSETNHNGGINGGISNGLPIIFNTAIKPTSSIFKEINTIDFIKEENATLKLTGRHDPAIVRRVGLVITSLVAVVLCDILEGRFGTDYFR